MSVLYVSVMFAKSLRHVLYLKPNGLLGLMKWSAMYVCNIDPRWGWVVNATPRPLYARERPDTHCIGGWVGPRAGLDGCGKSPPQWDSIPGPSAHELRGAFFTYKTLQYYLPVGGKARPCWLDSWLVSCSAGSEHCRQQSRGPSRTFCLAVGPLADSNQLHHILCNCLSHLAGPCIVLCMQNLRK